MTTSNNLEVRNAQVFGDSWALGQVSRIISIIELNKYFLVYLFTQSFYSYRKIYLDNTILCHICIVIHN